MYSTCIQFLVSNYESSIMSLLEEQDRQQGVKKHDFTGLEELMMIVIIIMWNAML